MLSPIDELRIQAKKRCTEAQLNASLLKTPRLTLKQIQLKTARSYGFIDWLHAREVLACRSGFPQRGYGKFWYSTRCVTLLNIWCTSIAEAKSLQQRQGGVILPYQNQFILANDEYLSTIGLTLDDPLWNGLAHNWCEGPDELRQEMALKRIQAQRLL